MPSHISELDASFFSKFECFGIVRSKIGIDRKQICRSISQIIKRMLIVKKFLERIIFFKIKFQSTFMNQSKTRNNFMIKNTRNISNINHRHDTNIRWFNRFRLYIIFKQRQKQHTKRKGKECSQKHYSRTISYHEFSNNKNMQHKYS